jgi:hypothetical protein
LATLPAHTVDRVADYVDLSGQLRVVLQMALCAGQ